jgi:hypothetical protein
VKTWWLLQNTGLSRISRKASRRLGLRLSHSFTLRLTAPASKWPGRDKTPVLSELRAGATLQLAECARVARSSVAGEIGGASKPKVGRAGCMMLQGHELRRGVLSRASWSKVTKMDNIRANVGRRP